MRETGVLQPASIEYLAKRAVLAPTNEHVSDINDTALSLLAPDGETTYIATNSIRDATHDNLLDYSMEFLASVENTGLPPQRLSLRRGSLLVLIRNLDFRSGLINGVRLFLVAMQKRVLDVLVLTGPAEGKRVFLPRIPMTGEQGDLPIALVRRQFPVRLAYGVSVNKSQGQTLLRVGILLREPCFAHGQLYVALSRVRSFRDVRVCVTPGAAQGLLPAPSPDWVTQNIVFHEVLPNRSPPPAEHPVLHVHRPPPPVLLEESSMPTTPPPRRRPSSPPTASKRVRLRCKTSSQRAADAPVYNGYFEHQLPGTTTCGLHALHNILGAPLWVETDVAQAAAVNFDSRFAHDAIIHGETLQDDIDGTGGNFSLNALGELLGTAHTRFQDVPELSLRALATADEFYESPNLRGLLQHRPGHWVAYKLQEKHCFFLDSLAPSPTYVSVADFRRACALYRHTFGVFALA